MSQVLAVLMHKRLLKLYRVAQDGTRVRASAGSASFRRKHPLERCLKEARAHLAALAREAEQQNSAPTARVEAARRRAAREQAQRVEQALDELEQMGAAKAQAKNHPQRKGEVRVSATDPQARAMKLGGGGCAPAYNLPFATDTESRIIVGVGATNSGVDRQQLEPMQDRIEGRTQATRQQHLADGGYLNFAAFEHSAQRGIEVFSPPRQHRTCKIDPLKVQPNASPAIADWRRRMASPEGQAIYRERAATAETVNADLQNLARTGPPGAPRPHQGPHRRDLVGAHLQSDARDQYGLALTSPFPHPTAQPKPSRPYRRPTNTSARRNPIPSQALGMTQRTEWHRKKIRSEMASSPFCD